jgi:hypothetical protein
MRADAARADRFQSVREAARAWTRAGAIDEQQRTQIDVLAGTASFFGGLALVGATVWTLSQIGTVLILCSIGFLVLTEYQTGPLRRTHAGAELATAFLAVLTACGGVAALTRDIEGPVPFAIAALLSATGAWRWGFASLGALASFFTLLALARLPMGRVWWIAACLVAIVVSSARARLERLAPAHRRCLRVALGASLLALYLAIHYDSVKGGEFGWLYDPENWGRGALAVSAVLTALLPVAILAFGVRRRDRVAIAIGALLVGVSLSTWRYHWPWLPLWMTLTAGGAACFVTAILVRRFLDRAPAREWRGITADPLFDDPRGAAALRVAALAATLGHAPQAASGDRPFQAGGGASGGGGADGRL